MCSRSAVAERPRPPSPGRRSRGSRPGGTPGPSSSTVEGELAALPPGRDRDPPAPGALRAAVADRVLDQRLEQHRRHQRVAGARVDVDRHLQPVAEARLHRAPGRRRAPRADGERYLLGLIPLRGPQRGPKQLGQAVDHLVRRRRVVVHGGRDGVQGVEQEVRLELEAEAAQLGAGEVRLQARGVELALAGGAQAVHARDHGGHDHERHHVVRQLHGEAHRHATVVVRAQAGERVRERAKHPVGAGVGGGEDEERNEVEGQPPPGPGAAERPRAHQPAHAEEEEPGAESGGHLVQKGRERRPLAALGQVRQVVAGERQQPDSDHEAGPQQPPSPALRQGPPEGRGGHTSRLSCTHAGSIEAEARASLRTGTGGTSPGRAGPRLAQGARPARIGHPQPQPAARATGRTCRIS